MGDTKTLLLALADLSSPVSHSAYDKSSQKIHQAVKDIAVEVRRVSAEEVHMLAAVATAVDKSETCKSSSSSSEVTAADDGVVDRTWQEREFSSLDGTVAAISVDTGKVFDVEIMSRYCQACFTNTPLEKKDPEKFPVFQAHLFVA